jgi:asparagine synthase (glutamine-hydrolysing)
MCGVSLCFSLSLGPEEVAARLAAMERVQAHRGPDGTGAIIEPAGAGVLGIGQQRLSILDLTPAGSQPMVSPCGRYVVSYNGEVYNYKELAAELGDDPIVAQSTGDTAVVLAALVRWGVEALPRFNGMWALAFFDRHTGRLLLSRDRLGVKPLYFACADRTLVMASEVKGVLFGSGDRQFSLNRNVVARFLLQSLVSGQPETLFEGIEAFPAGSYAEIDLGASSIRIEPKAFWRHPFEIGRAEGPAPTKDEIREVFLDSVRLRLRSDVPVGIMLSGGLDSSAILAAARLAMPDGNLRALSVVSRDPAANEEPYIDRMVAHVGCEITKLQSDDDPVHLWESIEDTVWHYDAPVSDFSNIAHRNIIRHAREQGLVVLLTGQGADEQLGGYNKFLYFYLQDRMRRGIFGGPLSMLAGCLRNGTILPEFTAAHAKRYLPFMRKRLAKDWLGPALADADLLDTGLGASYEEREWRDIRHLSMPDLLTSEDRASMSHSCEMRTPFLDYRLVEAFGRTPPEAKLVRGWTKHIMREAMAGLLPPEIVWRKDKKGYTLPGALWMRTVLRSRIEAFLDGPLLVAELGLIQPAGARALFQSLVEGRSHVRFSDVLSIVSLEIWLRRFAPHIHGLAKGMERASPSPRPVPCEVC